MLRIISKNIPRVIYLDRPYDQNSMQVVSEDVKKVYEIASMGGVTVEKFSGDLHWVEEWVNNLKHMGLLPI